MKATLFGLVALISMSLGMTACGDDDDITHQDVIRTATQEVQACIAQGGDPVFATNSMGQVTQFLGCGQP